MVRAYVGGAAPWRLPWRRVGTFSPIGGGRVITANVIYRVFRLRIGDTTGTGFAIEAGGREYLVTARHIAEPVDRKDTIHLFENGDWRALGVSLVGHAPRDIDISVLAASTRLTPERSLPLPATSEGLIYGQDAFFLGFPHGLSDLVLGDTGRPVPLVKRATVSSLQGEPFLLDGHNNPGFSGGPVVFQIPGSREFRVAAVIQGYRPAREPIYLDDGTETDLYLRGNTGIIFAYNISAAVELAESNPIGLALLA
ncbi:MAG: trypsin-like peptidase domain-containing protein [Chloroflexi bacterium]|nr:trypsin-like peptidase domain-containing protein [Chloroflexota bacterium]